MGTEWPAVIESWLVMTALTQPKGMFTDLFDPFIYWELVDTVSMIKTIGVTC